MMVMGEVLYVIAESGLELKSVTESTAGVTESGFGLEWLMEGEDGGEIKRVAEVPFFRFHVLGN